MMGKFFSAAIFAAVIIASANAIPVTKETTLADAQIRAISEVLFDLGTHVLQTGKAAAAMNDGSGSSQYSIARVWSFDYTKQVCSANNTDCEDVHEQIRIGGVDENEWASSWLDGVLGNDASIVFEKNSFAYQFTIENIEFVSKDYQRVSTNLNSGVQMIYSGLYLQVANSSVGLSADFGFADGIFQVSNVKVLVDFGRVHMKVDNVVRNDNGSWTDLEPIEQEAAPLIMELWRSTDDNGVTLETRYSSFVEEKINDILAGRSTF